MGRAGTHVIVVGNEKGGSGKSTTAFHLAIYLLYQGYKVASIDVDSRQQTLTHYVRNRRDWARQRGLSLPHTTHFHLPLARGDSLKENNRVEFDLFRQAIAEVEQSTEFIVIDTPGFDTNLTRLAHSLRLLGYRFTPQVPLPGMRDYRGDFGLDDEPVVMEFDGVGKYLLATTDATAGSEAAMRQRLVAEKRREEDIRRHAGCEFARFGWSEVGDLPLVRARVEAARDRARRRRSA